MPINSRNSPANHFDRLESLQSLDDFFTDLAGFVDRQDLFQFVFVAVPQFYSPSKDKNPPIITTTYDPTWMQYYVDKRYDLYDRALNHSLSSSSPSPFLWRRNYRTYSPKEMKVYLEATEVDIVVGMTVPLQNSLGALSLMSLTYKGSERDFDKLYEAKITEILPYLYMFNETILDKHAAHFGAPIVPKITDVEREILRYLANGYSRKQVAEKKIRAVGTLDKQINRIIYKLKAKNIVHAVALSLKWGLLK